jgi:hypothetical protein
MAQAILRISLVFKALQSYDDNQNGMCKTIYGRPRKRAHP